MISVVVNSCNEGEKLDKCLKSVIGWADEIVVVDMESQDNTVEVAKKFKAKIFTHQFINYVEPVRKFAVSKSTQPWVLILDPDEVVTEILKKKLTEIAQISEVEAVNIPRLNIFFQKKIRHTNFWPDRQIRFLKKDKVVFSETIHSYPKINGQILNLPAREDLAIYHYGYKNLSEYIQRMKRYSDIEAQNIFDNHGKFSLKDLIYKPAYDFLRRYVRHLGFLDGWTGFVLSLLQAYYYFLVEFKLWKLEQK